MADVSHQVIVWIERRPDYAPLLPTMAALANALEVELGWLWFLEPVA